MKADAKTSADKLITQLKKRRDEFQAKVNADAQAGEREMQAAKAQLESRWSGFEAQLKTYFQTVGKQIEQQRATFRDIAADELSSAISPAMSPAASPMLTPDIM